MFGFGPNGDHSTEIEALGKAIQQTGRPILLSLSPGARDASNAEFVMKHAEMWRISNDFWDRWIDLKNQFKRFDSWHPYAGPGHWPDGDMLPLGHIGIRAERGDPRMSLLTHDEQLALMTLWSIARSPLMFGGHLPDNDEFTLSLLTNDEVLAVNQKVQTSKQLFAHDNQIAWVANVPGSKAKYLAVFSIADQGEEKVRVDWSELGLPAKCSVRDLWSHQDLGTTETGRDFAVKPHASGFYKIVPVI